MARSRVVHWTVAAVAEATDGRPTAGDPQLGLSGVVLDSRLMVPGSLFVALVAERDGHQFVPQAIAAGAGAVMVERGRAPDLRAPHRRAPGAPDRSPGPGVIEVVDTVVALALLGRAARRRLRVTVVGVTGSVGKTSTKDLMAAALARRWRTAASEKSFNNELGVPLTLANAAEDTEMAVIEMGARGAGHIARLCQIAEPSVAVVTAVAAVHTALFGSLEAVASAKGELVEAIGPGGAVVLNGDDPAVTAMAGRAGRAVDVLRYSASGHTEADVIATAVVVADDLRSSFWLRSPWGAAEVHLGVRGVHNVANALAAATVALRCHVTLDDVVASLATATVAPWRMQLGRTAAGAAVLNDAYNANPTSMKAALRSLARLPARRRVAVVAEMAELGDQAAAAHLEMADLADELGIELIVVATPLYGRPAVVDIDAAFDTLVADGPLDRDDAVLVKASRVAGLERLAERILAARPAAGP